MEMVDRSHNTSHYWDSRNQLTHNHTSLSQAPSSSKRPRVQDDISFTIMKRLSLRENPDDDSAGEFYDASVDMASYDVGYDHNGSNCIDLGSRESGTSVEFYGSGHELIPPAFTGTARRKSVDWFVDDVIRKAYRRSFDQSSISLSVIPRDFDPTLPTLGPRPTNDLRLQCQPHCQIDDGYESEELGLDNSKSVDEPSIFGLDYSLYDYHQAINKPRLVGAAANTQRFSGAVSHGECFLDDEVS